MHRLVLTVLPSLRQRQVIREIMQTKRIGAYVGIDPTAPSLHIGHLIPLMPLFWMYMHGYGAHTLVGGATAKIGDPSGRLKDRDPMDKTALTKNMTKIHFQLKRLWTNVEAQARLQGYKKDWAWRRAIHNNNTWWNSLPMLEVLKRVGTQLRIGPMLGRDTVKRKMTEGDGVSFAEFSYPVMQGWDWWHLFSSPFRVQMQIGGSDQYGNIISGAEIVRAARDSEPDPDKVLPANSPHDDPIGFTVPLLTDSSGAKFGKSAGNAIWLDPFQTTTFDLYGYFVRRPDADVEGLLKMFTFLPMEDIKDAMEKQNQDPSKRVAQHLLAYNVVSLVHGQQAAQEAKAQHQSMYAKPTAVQGWDYAAVEGHPTTPNNAPRVDMILPESVIMGKSISSILHAAGLASSRADGQRLAVQKAAYVGGSPGQKSSVNKGMVPGQLTFTPVATWHPDDTKNFLIDGKLLILRKGKHNVRVIEMVSDEEYAKSGQTYSGQPYTGRVRKMKQELEELEKRAASGAGASPETTAKEAGSSKEDGDEPEFVFPRKKGPHELELEEKLKAHRK